MSNRFLTERESAKVLIKMALSHLGHGTDAFLKRSLDFYKSLRENEILGFSVENNYSLEFAFCDEPDEDKTVAVGLYCIFEGEHYPIIEHAQFGFKENNAHLAFLALIGGLQRKLRDAWRAEDASENNQGGEK